MRSLPSSPRFAVLTLATLCLLAATRGASHSTAASLDPRHPAVLAGRLEGIRADGGWVDVGAPLTREEQERLGGYHTPSVFGEPEVPGAPLPRADGPRQDYLDLHAR